MVMDVATRRPAGALAHAVERYVGYRLEGFPPGIHRGLPSRRLTVIVSLDEPVQMDSVPGYAGPTAMWAFVGGLHTRAAVIRHDGRQHGIAIELTPLGARGLLGLPAGELTGTAVELPYLLGRPGRDLVERLAEAEGWEARFDVLDMVLLRALRERAALPGSGALERALWRMVADGGRLDAGALAREVGWSRRHLAAQVRREVGLPPRQLARVIRLQRCCGVLRGGRWSTFGEVAAAAGYFDQAHMLHEWESLVGCRPAQWLGEELPSVQDRAAAGVAD